MQSTQQPKPFYPEAIRFTGLMGALVVPCGIWMVLASGYARMIPLLLMSLVAGIGTVITGLRCLIYFTSSQLSQAGAYLVSSVALGLLTWLLAWVLANLSDG